MLKAPKNWDGLDIFEAISTDSNALVCRKSVFRSNDFAKRIEAYMHLGWEMAPSPALAVFLCHIFFY